MRMYRNRTLLAAAAAALAVVLATRGRAQETRCGEGQAPMLDLGIETLRFDRANLMPVDERLIWSFASEPWVMTVRPGGPAEGKLEPNDRVVSIDGQLITSAEGGRRWSGVGVGRTVALVVRRAGREREVRIEGSLRCQALPWRWPARSGRLDRSYTILTPTVLGDSAGQLYARALRDSRPSSDSARGFVRGQYVPGRTDSGYARALRDYAAAGRPGRTTLREGYVGLAREGRHARVQARFRVLFGFGIFCADCAFETDSTGAPFSWEFSSPPTVTDIQDGSPAARGGLRVGDVIEAVDGALITDADGARRFSEAQPGRPLRFTVRRNGTNVTVEVVPVSPTAARPRPD